MQTQEDVPATLIEVDELWLTRALQKNGRLGNGRVSSVNRRIISEGVGFNGDVAILELEYEGGENAPPASMVIKLPTTSKNRIVGQTMGLYEKEIRFYRDLADSLDIRTPEHFCSALDVADDPDVVLERMEGLNKLPMWLIGLLSSLAQWAVSKSLRRYALVIEDLSGYRMGDQAAGCTVDEMRRVLDTMATLHAQFWANPRLDEMSWITHVTLITRVLHSVFQKNHKRLDRSQRSVSELGIVDWLAEHGTALTDRIGAEPKTLLHGDVRLDNICFDDEDDSVVLLDWQTMQSGPAGMDLAYFISATLPRDEDLSAVDELVTYYHTALTERGVPISLARLRWQYEAGLAIILHRVLPTLTNDDMDIGDDRGRQVLEAWVDNIFRCIAPVDYVRLLTDIPD